MTTFNFSAIGGGAVLAFNPASDVLVFDDPSVSAASVVLGYASGFGSVSFVAGGKSFTLSASVLVTQLSGLNVVFADGSRLIVGDDSTANDDILANVVIGSVGADQLLGLTGNDTLAGGAGNDRLDGGAGLDLLKGGRGADTYIVDDAGDVVDDSASVDTLRVSTSSTGAQAAGASVDGSVSADGRFVVFSSYAENLSAGDTNKKQDIFLKDLQTGELSIVSTTTAGAAGDADSSAAQRSADGRFVIFESLAGNLLPGDNNAALDVFLKDLQTGDLLGVSVSAAGIAGNGASRGAAVSADGRYVLFQSLASNLVAGDTNGASDIFVKDLQTGAVQRVSTNAVGTQGNGSSVQGQWSADGRHVLYDSTAANLVSGDTNASADVFVKDLQTGAVQRVSTSTTSAQGNGASSNAQFSADGTRVVFESSATNLVTGDLNAARDVFVKDLVSGALQRVSTSSTGAEGNGESTAARISADGRFVVFQSLASNLVAGDTNAAYDVFVKDLQSGAIQRVSTDLNGTQAAASAVNADISADGRFIVFSSTAAGLVAGDTNGANDVFRVANPFIADAGVDTVLAGVSHTLSAGVENLTLTGAAAINGSGNDLANRLTGNSAANQLSGAAGNDTLDGGAGNDTLAGGTGNDLYVVDSTADIVTEFSGVDPTRASTGQVGQQLNGASGRAEISGNGRLLVFETSASNALPLDTNGQFDVFVKNLQTGALQRISVSETGVQGNGFSGEASLSADGRWVLFTSLASNLVEGDGNASLDVFLKDLQTGALQRVSVDADGASGSAGSNAGRLSADASKVLFISQAGNLFGSSGTATAQVLVKNLETGELQVASSTAEGVLGNGTASAARFSNDGEKVVFSSTANILAAGDANFANDVFVKDLGTGLVQAVSTTAAGVMGNGASTNAVFSNSDGIVFFESAASNLVDGDTNGVIDIFRKDLGTGVVTRVSTAADGAQATGGASTGARLSADGRYLAFQSAATNLVAGDTNAALDVFVKDLQTGAVQRVSVDAGGLQGSGVSTAPGGFSADGRQLVLQSASASLVSGDSNALYDVFVVRNPFLGSGGGIDTVRSSASATLAANVENLVLTGPAAINGTGNALANQITGNGAPNFLVGGLGSDTLTGGAGNDTYSVDSAGDRVVEAAGGGKDIVSSVVSYTLPAQVESLVLTGSAQLDGTGNTLDNTLTGNDGANRLDGGSGNDTLSGGSGDDTLLGGSGIDSMVGGFGNDTYLVDSSGDIVTEATGASTGTDTIVTALSYSLAALPAVENLTLTGNFGASATGNGANNVLQGNVGNNLIQGGAGFDTASYANATAGVIVSLAVSGGQSTGFGVDVLSGIERLTGSPFEDVLIGSIGADTLDGGGAADLLIGGKGNDTYQVDTGSDGIVEAAGEGIDLVLASGSYTLGAEVENLTLVGTGSSSAVGNALRNVLSGNLGDNVLVGGGGLDTVSYAGATAAVDANLGTGRGTGMGNDTFVGIYRLLGSPLADRLTGSSSTSGLGFSELDGGAGNDTLVSGTGEDSFYFSTALGAANVDSIQGFNRAVDQIGLSPTLFTRLADLVGQLNPAFFAANTSGVAGDVNDYVVYETDTGRLFYDTDGNGTATPQLIATLVGAPALTAAEIYVFGF